MNRRAFLRSAAASVAPLALGAGAASGAAAPRPGVRPTPRVPEWAAAATRTDAPARITRVTLTPVTGRFHKFVAMNAYDTAPKGHTYGNTLVRVATDQGVEGVGVMEYAAPDEDFVAAVRGLVGADVLGVYERGEGGRITGRATPFRDILGRYPHLDGPLYDLIGKLEGRPAWQLVGAPVRDRVPAYDGTLYFSDVWFADRGARAVVEEAEEAARKGYPALKLKIGRGFRWMESDAGMRRDIEVVKAVRRAVGADVRILVDANNGWRDGPEHAWRFLEATAGDDVHFLEEPFPEDVQAYAALKDRMAAAGLDTVLADGENLREPAPFAPFLRPRRLIDVLQLDIRRGGILGNLELARMGAPVGAVSVPHNWGSQVGLFMSLHFAKAVENVTAAEDDRSTIDAVVADGYAFRDGHWTVSDAPGMGLSVDEATYRRKYAAAEQVVG